MSRQPLTLTHRQRGRLRRQLEETRDASVYRRTLALLEVGRGIGVAQVARTLGVARRTIYYWIESYRETSDPTVLADAPRPGRPSLWSDDLKDLLQALLVDHTPDQLGYYAVNWTVPLLQEQLEHSTGRHLSDDTIRRQMQRLGYVWKRSRYVLDPDSEEGKKTADPPEDSAIAAPERPAGRG